MRWLAKRTLIGVYLCPHGVFAVEFRRARGGYAIKRSFEAPGTLRSPAEAADRLVDALREAGVERADVAVAVRGFGVVHHILQMPPATDEILAPIVEREMFRLEPQLGDSVIEWVSLPPLRGPAGEEVNQRSLIAIGAPTALINALEQNLRAAGFRFLHLTGLPVAMQRLVEDFDPNPESSGVIAALPDGAFLGFALDGALRLVIEPHFPQDGEHDLAALAEEAQLGVIFVRQQFRGIQINHLNIVGTSHSLAEAEHVLSERVGIPVSRYRIRDLTAAAYAALGAVLDAQSSTPLSLAGSSRGRTTQKRTSVALDNASYAAVALATLLAAATAVQAFRSHDAASAAHEASARITRDSLALAPVRAVAMQRKAAHDAAEAMRLGDADRRELQRALVGIANAVRSAVRLDSMHLDRSEDGWSARLAGQVSGATSARALQSIDDLYREIPRLLSVDSIKLDQLTYDEVGDEGGLAAVRFTLSFAISPRRKE